MKGYQSGRTLFGLVICNVVCVDGLPCGQVMDQLNRGVHCRILRQDIPNTVGGYLIVVSMVNFRLDPWLAP